MKIEVQQKSNVNFKPTVSIIIPVYNSAPLLKKTVENLLKQTYTSIEFIVVDDSSTDDSYNVAQAFKSENFKVIRQDNAGAAVARNTGLLHATGEYIQFMDADDYLSVDKIKEQVKALNGSMDKVAVCNYLNFFNDSEINSLKYSHDQDNFIFSTNEPVDFLLNLYGANSQYNFIQTNCWLVPKGLIDKAGGWRNYRCPDDDGEFFARVLLAASGIIYTPGVYNYYRRSISNNVLSQNRQYKYLHNTLLTIDLKYSYLSKYVNDYKLKKAFATQYLNYAVATYLPCRILSDLAYKRYSKFKIDVDPPKIGGVTVEFLKKIIGWRFSLKIKFFIKQLV